MAIGLDCQVIRYNRGSGGCVLKKRRVMFPGGELCLKQVPRAHIHTPVFKPAKRRALTGHWKLPEKNRGLSPAVAPRAALPEQAWSSPGPLCLGSSWNTFFSLFFIKVLYVCIPYQPPPYPHWNTF